MFKQAISSYLDFLFKNRYFADSERDLTREELYNNLSCPSRSHILLQLKIAIDIIWTCERFLHENVNPEIHIDLFLRLFFTPPFPTSHFWSIYAEPDDELQGEYFEKFVLPPSWMFSVNVVVCLASHVARVIVFYSTATLSSHPFFASYFSFNLWCQWKIF